MAIDATATYDNPFDPDDFALDAQVTLPDGRKWQVPGFFYRPFERKQAENRETLSPSGDPGWRVRFAPPLPGEYSTVVILRDRTGNRESAPLHFSAEAAQTPGCVRISPRDHRYFEFDNGAAYFPIGLNICWPGREAKTLDYDAWFPAFAKAGCNATRLWLSPDWNPLALERTGRQEDGLGMGQIDLAAAWRLDHVLSLAQENGLYAKLCIDSYNILRHTDGYPHWEKTPHNAANGGPLREPKDFWSNPAMERFYRNKLRYLVARYGWSPNVLSWEFWNEVDITSDYQTQPACDWHIRMARYLRSIDPYRHLITTSFARSEGDRAIDAIPEIDYVQTHLYGGDDPVVRLFGYQKQKESFGKPHYVGEFGADAGGDRFADDPEGVQIHDPLWISVADGGSGAAQPWYWEAVHARSMHGLFAAVAKFTSGIDWPSEQMRRVEPRCQWSTPPDPLPRKDLVFETTRPLFTASEYNRPRTVQIDRSGVHGQVPLAGIQHGITAHKDWHNPVRFEFDLPWGAKLGVRVRGVSGWSGAGMEIRLDGHVALAKDFPNTNASDDHKDLLQYNGWYEVDVPPGKHVVELENRGVDWFYCNYRLRDGLECPKPPLLVWAMAGRNTALAWVRLEPRSWTRVCVDKESFPVCQPTVLQMPELARGHWKAELWDTWEGRILQEQTVQADTEGTARIALPEIAKDLAVRLKRID
jgi:hypothetical protein